MLAWESFGEGWVSDVAKELKLAETTLRALGQRPFYPPSVGGWPHGQVWLSTASAEARAWRAAGRIEASVCRTVA